MPNSMTFSPEPVARARRIALGFALSVCAPRSPRSRRSPRVPRDVERADAGGAHAARQAREDHPPEAARERPRGDRRREPRRAARDGRDRRAERLVHADARVRGARAHVRAHVLQGNKDFPEPEQFIDRAAELGAVFNGHDAGRGGELLPHRARGSARWRYAASSRRRFAQPLFREEELEREREVVLGEYDRNESSPFFKLDEQMGQALYTGRVEPQEHDRRPRHRAHDHAREDAHDPA